MRMLRCEAELAIQVRDGATADGDLGADGRGSKRPRCLYKDLRSSSPRLDEQRGSVLEAGGPQQQGFGRGSAAGSLEEVCLLICAMNFEQRECTANNVVRFMLAPLPGGGGIRFRGSVLIDLCNEL
ncbi:hypothetical protein Taro_018717 [Colocasia esculenta]|uniref:Uncharacterized protein n=1 Tax=Colocasia esculenta TaxID=4460 RepID=A0A843UX32_COLES|nr:hypothetical protein [Colocasia esculenta]